MEPASFGIVMLASLIAAGVTTVGIVAISRHQEWARRNAVHIKGFAAGLLISITLLHLLPESSEMRQGPQPFVLGGLLGIYLLNQLLGLYVRWNGGLTDTPASTLSALGIGLHSFVDGVIFAVTFNVSIFTGVAAAIGMVLHEFPEGIITFVLLERGGVDRRKALLLAFALAALSTPIGALVAYPFVQELGSGTLGTLLALTAGVLLYVGAAHLLPEVETEGKAQGMISVAAGVLVAIAIVLVHG